MRLPAILLAASLLSSCAYQGVIVRKESRPHPLYHSIGVDAVYAFILRDSSSVLHRQLVTPEVFEAYAEGQFFNDLQAAPVGQDPKNVQPVAPTAPAFHSTDPVPFPTPTRVSEAVPPIESTRSFRASELAHSSRSMTATLRTEVPHDAPVAADGMQTNAQAEAVPAADKAPVQPTKQVKKTARSSSSSTKSKSKSSAKKPAKLWRETEPVVQSPGNASVPMAEASVPDRD